MEVLCFLPSTHYPLYDCDLRATHARTLMPAALASVSFGFVLVRVRSSPADASVVTVPIAPLCIMCLCGKVANRSGCGDGAAEMG